MGGEQEEAGSLEGDSKPCHGGAVATECQSLGEAGWALLLSSLSPKTPDQESGSRERAADGTAGHRPAPWLPRGWGRGNLVPLLLPGLSHPDSEGKLG